jgi:hypothetical protein
MRWADVVAYSGIVFITLLALLAFSGTADAGTFNSCTNISYAGTWTMTGSITNQAATDHCVKIAANGVTIDCNGYTIDGNDTLTYYGIIDNAPPQYYNNTIIKNCIISDWNYGIFAEGHQTNFDNLTTFSNTAGGIFKYDDATQLVEDYFNASNILTYNNGGHGFIAYAGQVIATNITSENNTGTNAIGLAIIGSTATKNHTVINYTGKNNTVNFEIGAAGVTILSVINSTLSLDTTISIKLRNSSIGYFINSTYNRTRLNFVAATSIGGVYTSQYARLNITKSDGTAGIGASVLVNDSTPVTVYSATTGASGITPFYLFHDLWQNRTGNFTKNNHTFALLPTGGYSYNTTSLNITSPLTDITVNLSSDYDDANYINNCWQMNASGTYKLTSDVNVASPSDSCIKIYSNSVTFDCQGHRIDLGASASWVPITTFFNTTYYNNTVIKNCILQGGLRGIWGAGNNHVYSNITTNNQSEGILSTLGNNVTIYNISVYNCSAALNLGDTNTTVENSTLNGVTTDIAVAAGAYVTTTNLTFSVSKISVITNGVLLKRENIRLNFTAGGAADNAKWNFTDKVLGNFHTGIASGGLTNFYIVNDTLYSATKTIYNNHSINATPATALYYFTQSSLNFTTSGTWNISLKSTNAAPTLVSATLFPTTPTDHTYLRCDLGATADADSDPVTVSIRWWKGGVLQGGLTGNTKITFGNLTVGNVWNCSGVPNDGVQNGAETFSTAVTIGVHKYVYLDSSKQLRNDTGILTGFGATVQQINTWVPFSQDVYIDTMNASQWYIDAPALKAMGANYVTMRGRWSWVESDGTLNSTQLALAEAILDISKNNSLYTELWVDTTHDYPANLTLNDSIGLNVNDTTLAIYLQNMGVIADYFKNRTDLLGWRSEMEAFNLISDDWLGYEGCLGGKNVACNQSWQSWLTAEGDAAYWSARWNVTYASIAAIPYPNFTSGTDPIAPDYIRFREYRISNAMAKVWNVTNYYDPYHLQIATGFAYTSYGKAYTGYQNLSLFSDFDILGGTSYPSDYATIPNDFISIHETTSLSVVHPTGKAMMVSEAGVAGYDLSPTDNTDWFSLTMAESIIGNSSYTPMWVFEHCYNETTATKNPCYYAVQRLFQNASSKQYTQKSRTAKVAIIAENEWFASGGNGYYGVYTWYRIGNALSLLGVPFDTIPSYAINETNLGKYSLIIVPPQYQQLSAKNWDDLQSWIKGTTTRRLVLSSFYPFDTNFKWTGTDATLQELLGYTSTNFPTPTAFVAGAHTVDFNATALGFTSGQTVSFDVTATDGYLLLPAGSNADTTIIGKLDNGAGSPFVSVHNYGAGIYGKIYYFGYLGSQWSPVNEQANFDDLSKLFAGLVADAGLDRDFGQEDMKYGMSTDGMSLIAIKRYTDTNTLISNFTTNYAYYDENESITNEMRATGETKIYALALAKYEFTTAERRNLTVITNGTVNSTITNWNSTVMSWNGTGSTSAQANYTICGLATGTKFTVNVSGNQFVNTTTTASGCLNFTYGSWSDHNFTVYKNDWSAAPSITFVSQQPADITSTNIIGMTMNATYNVTDSDGLNTTSRNFWLQVNDSTTTCLIHQNGTSICGFYSENHKITNTSEIWKMGAQDNEVYPATYPLDRDIMEEVTHSIGTLTNANQFIKLTLLNVSPASQYGFFEVMAKRTAGAGSMPVYYCNSTYATGQPSNSVNCAQIGTIAATADYNHTHGSNSSHMVIPFGINTTAGTINGIKITANSTFILRGSTGSTWGYSYIANISRANTVQTSGNNGNTWANFAGTLDAHLHQYNGSTSVCYKVEFYDLLGNGANSTETCDTLDFTPLAPTAPSVTSPTEGQIARRGDVVAIAYAESSSPNGDALAFYNITLVDASFAYVSTIYTNNSLNLAYNWDTDAISPDEYRVAVKATDNKSYSTTGYSRLFTIAGNATITATISSGVVDTDDLNCSATFSDLINTTLWVNFTWWNGTTQVTAFDNQTLCTNATACYTGTLIPNAQTVVGEVWRCQVQADNGTVWVSDATNSSAGTITASGGGGGGGGGGGTSCTWPLVLCPDGTCKLICTVTPPPGPCPASDYKCQVDTVIKGQTSGVDNAFIAGIGGLSFIFADLERSKDKKKRSKKTTYSYFSVGIVIALAYVALVWAGVV